MFSCNYNAGFKMRFDSGILISVQFHANAYCSNKSREYNVNSLEKGKLNNFNSSKDAEVMIWLDGTNKVFPLSENDDEKGWLSTNQVAYLINMCATAKDFEELLSKIEEIRNHLI